MNTGSLVAEVLLAVVLQVTSKKGELKRTGIVKAHNRKRYL